jgi:hypothetical protein
MMARKNKRADNSFTHKDGVFDPFWMAEDHGDDCVIGVTEKGRNVDLSDVDEDSIKDFIDRMQAEGLL